MKTKVTLASGLIITMIALSTGLLTKDVTADGHEFGISVYHGINGRSLGLSKELPVEATIYLNGELLTVLQLQFKDRIETTLPPGEYEIMVESVEAGPLPSMTVGPVEIPAGVNVNLHAKLSGGKTPIISVR